MDDTHRPKYHYLPARGWMNDPNGLIQFEGKYHLFCQHNPEWPTSGKVLWGHAASDDLVRWSHLPHALFPDMPYDSDGVWSGCAVNDNGTPVLIYTGVHPEVQCIAIGDRDMLHFRKYEENPVIAAPPRDLEVTGFRDPYVWRNGNEWLMVIGSGIKDKGGAILLYRSDDLRKWEYLHPAFVGDSNDTGEMWECPNFIRISDRWVLFVAVNSRSIYFVGDFDDGRFVPVYRGETDLGGSLYAPQVFRDQSRRVVLFGWLWERQSPESQAAAGWAGVQSLPRVVTLSPTGHLDFAPVPEVDSLRDDLLFHSTMTDLKRGFSLELQTNTIEIAAEIEPQDFGVCQIAVLRSPDGCEETVVSCDLGARTLSIDTTKSSLDESAVRELRSVRMSDRDGRVSLRIFVDRSVVEAYANGTVLTARVYPRKADSTQVRISAGGVSCPVGSLDVWRIMDVSPTAATFP